MRPSVSIESPEYIFCSNVKPPSIVGVVLLHLSVLSNILSVFINSPSPFAR